MKTASRILLIYLSSLLLFSLLFSLAGITNFSWNIFKLKIAVSPMTMLTVAGGIISLKYAVSPQSLKLFLKIYFCLWILEYLVIYTGNQIGEVFLRNRSYRFDLILKYHYENYTRLNTPLPFITFWFINYVFSKPAMNDKNQLK